MEETKPMTKYVVGQTYDFTVNSVRYNFCELVDGDGFFVYLQHTEGLNLTKGQTIRCRVTANYQKRPKIELVDSSRYSDGASKISVESVSRIMNTPERQWDTTSFVSLLLMTEVEDKTFGGECRQWIEELRKDECDLTQVKADCGQFMEESDFLSICNTTERELYQQRLTFIIDSLGYFIEADKLLADGTAPQFLEHLLDKLEKTGYVYHPEQNFKVMSILFLIDGSLMEENIPRLFDIIRKWPADIWNKDPFKDPLIRALTLYVDGNILKVEKISDNGKLVRNLVQALAILFIIADNKDNHDTRLPDERLLLSRLCVMSTYIDEFCNKELLAMAVSTLFSDSYYRPRPALADTLGYKIPFDLKTHSRLLPPWAVNTTNLYIGSRMRLVISPDGMAVWADSQKAKAVIPEQLALWGNIQVYANRSAMPSLSGQITVNDSRRLWEAIERELFTPDPTVVHTPEKRTTKPMKIVHGVGDVVTITINSVGEDENEKSDNRAWCTIEGEDSVSGYIYGQDIVSYMHHTATWMFEDYNGNPLSFNAVIIDEDDDGMFHFSMLEQIKEFVCSQFTYGEDVICSLGSSRKASVTNYPSPGITKDGYSVSLNGSIGEDLQRGDIVVGTYQSQANGTFHIYCDLKERYDGFKVDMARAFHNLMLNYANTPDDDYEEDGEKEDSMQLTSSDLDNTDRMVDAAYVKEIIRIVDRMAVIDADYVRSYNYIAFARLLCRMIGWNELGEYYSGRLHIIDMLYDFAINDKVDTSQLDRLQDEDGELFASDTPMHEKFRQLRIISFMGAQPHDDELMRFRGATQGMTRQIASLAIAYNILIENNMKPQANDVLNYVKNMLRLKGYESHLKVYGNGIESRTVEFKTSIVYPPSNDSMPDLRRQTHTILSVIASFLNTDGGTLYLGVNDSGAGVGVYDDLCYQEFNGDRDKYQRYVLDAVALQWDNNVASYVSADWDHSEESGKDVLVVHVEPYAKGVDLDGEWLYRNGSGNRHLSKSEFDEYNTRRQSRLARQSARQTETDTPESATDAVATSEPVTAAVPTVAEEAQPVTPAVAAAAPSGSSAKPAAPAQEKVMTSVRRKNILEDYQEGFVPYEACFKFLSGSKFEKVTEYDYDTTTELTLPVYEDDVKDRYLVLGYENGTIGKVPVREIMKFEDYRPYSRYGGSRLLFAAIASDADGIISVTEEDKTSHRTMVRVDTLANIDRCRLADAGCRVFNEGIATRTLQYEIAPAAGLSVVKNILDRDSRTLGFPLATMAPDITDQLRQWGIKDNG